MSSKQIWKRNAKFCLLIKPQGLRFCYTWGRNFIRCILREDGLFNATKKCFITTEHLHPQIYTQMRSWFVNPSKFHPKHPKWINYYLKCIKYRTVLHYHILQVCHFFVLLFLFFVHLLNKKFLVQTILSDHRASYLVEG